jgi:hypothetical protein
VAAGAKKQSFFLNFDFLACFKFAIKYIEENAFEIHVNNQINTVKNQLARNERKKIVFAQAGTPPNLRLVF